MTSSWVGKSLTFVGCGVERLDADRRGSQAGRPIPISQGGRDAIRLSDARARTPVMGIPDPPSPPTRAATSHRRRRHVIMATQALHVLRRGHARGRVQKLHRLRPHGTIRAAAGVAGTFNTRAARHVRCLFDIAVRRHDPDRLDQAAIVGGARAMASASEAHASFHIRL